MATWNNPDTARNYNYGTDWKSIGAGAGAVGAGGLSLFGGNGKSPSSAANQYLDQIPGQTGQYFDPYSQGGQNQFNQLGQQSTQLMNDPGGKYNQIGESFHQSPGFKFALEQALGGANRGAAAGGMAGSPMNQQQDMQLATDLANQDYYNYMGGATGLYGKGLDSATSMSQMGLNAGTNQANLVAQQLSQQASNAQEEQMAKNKKRAGAFSNIAGGLGAIGGGIFGGPAGAAAGYGVGSRL